MAVLTALPNGDVISGFRGVIDYYVFNPACVPGEETKGTPCARRWPSSPGHHRTAAVEAQWKNFADAAHIWKTLSAEVKDSYRQLAEGTPLTARDLFTRSYLSGLFTQE